MKVLTLDTEKFAKECLGLRVMVLSGGFSPDMVIAIARGGVYVAEHMHWPSVSVSLSRPSTGKKRGVLWRLLMRSPRFIKDWMRIAESVWLGFVERGTKVPDFDFNRETKEILTERTYRRILIVDDAVDSGKTLLAVRRAVANLLPDAEIRTAVLTVTRPHPLIRPDFTLHDNRTLIRFPWSEDN